MTEPQTWVLIGIFGTAIFSMFGLQTASLNRNFNTALGGLRESMDAKFDGVNAKFDGFRDSVDAKFDSMDAKFDGLRDSVDAKFDVLRAEFKTGLGATNAKIDGLDRDVQAISRRVFGADTP